MNTEKMQNARQAFSSFHFISIKGLSVVLLTTIAVIVISACGSENEYKIYNLPDQAATFLSGETGKTWKLAKRVNNGTRVNMGECTIGYRQTFLPDFAVSDNNSEMYDCGESMNGTWELIENKKGAAFLTITSDLVPKYFKVPEGSKTKYFQLVELSPGVLVYKFKHELFSTKTSIVVDVLVPEDSVVDDRNFHW